VNKKLFALALVSGCSAFAIGIAGCKQGRGERCQVDADCADGMHCSQSEPRTCGGDNLDQLDVMPPPEPSDAPIDAPTDTTIDGP